MDANRIAEIKALLEQWEQSKDSSDYLGLALLMGDLVKSIPDLLAALEEAQEQYWDAEEVGIQALEREQVLLDACEHALQVIDRQAGPGRLDSWEPALRAHLVAVTFRPGLQETGE